MGWRDIEAGVNDGSISFAQAPEKESFIQGVGRAVGNYLELNKDEIKAKAKAKADTAEALKTTEAANAKAAKMAKSAMNTYGFDVSDKQAYSSVLSYALLNPDLDNLNTWISKMDFPKVNQTATVPEVEPVSVVNGTDDTGAALNAGSPTVSETTSTGYTPINNALVLGESDNNINAIWQNQETKLFKNQKRVSEMTMKQLLTFVEEDGPYAEWSKTKSTTDQIHTPVGKHQFVGRTLRDIKDRKGFEALGIDDNTKFSEEVQDKLFNWYAKDTVTLADGRAEEARGEKATTEELREAFRGRWAAPISDNDMDAIIAKVKNGDYETVEAAEDSSAIVQTEAALAAGEAVQEITVAEKVVEDATYRMKPADPYKGKTVSELNIMLVNPRTSEIIKKEITTLLSKLPKKPDEDPLFGANTKDKLLILKADPPPQGSDALDKLLLDRITARLGVFTGELDINGMSEEEMRSHLSILTQKKTRETLSESEIKNVQRLEDALIPSNNAEELAKENDYTISSMPKPQLVSQIAIFEKLLTDGKGLTANQNIQLNAMRIALATGENTETATNLAAVGTLSSDEIERQIAILQDKKVLTPDEKVMLATLQSAAKPSRILTAAAVTEKAEQALKEGSTATFMAGINSIEDVMEKEGILLAMEAAVPAGSTDAADVAARNKNTQIRTLLTTQKNAFLARAKAIADAAVKDALAKSAQKTDGTKYVMYVYDKEDGGTGLLRQAETLTWDGTNWKNLKQQVIPAARVQAAQLYLPEQVALTVKMYNDEVTKMSNHVAATVTMTNSILALRQTAIDDPESLNGFTVSVGNLASKAEEIVTAYNSVLDASRGKPKTDMQKQQDYQTFKRTLIGKLSLKDDTQGQLNAEFLRLAYQMAKVRGSSGQGLSNAELDGILNSLGKGIADPEVFVQLMNKTLQAELKNAEDVRKIGINSAVSMSTGQGTSSEVTDILYRTVIGKPLSDTFLNLAKSDADGGTLRTQQYTDAMNNVGYIKPVTNQVEGQDGFKADGTPNIPFDNMPVQPVFPVTNREDRQPKYKSFLKVAADNEGDTVTDLEREQGKKYTKKEWVAAFGIEAWNWYTDLANKNRGK